jgi:osmotically-inducible protein OsmY
MKNRLMFLLLSTGFLLNGCATVAYDDPAINAELQNDRRDREALITDKQIETDINEELSDDEEISSQAHVNINAYNGAVLVTGEAATQPIKEKIIASVRLQDNVKLVHDHLSLAYPSDIFARNNDANMTENIKAALTQIRTLADFNSNMVKVVTEDSVVYLMGRVKREEGAVVINVVRHQPHVKQIITVFEYLD